ncbi:shufflon system plasmid conjugative transfer pilus tip adhesin PilV [Pectobacterium brasiliense]|uniref:shufflon system plasmid conjugative transfer pilus tip adhesin PilV n=1 Tax=Pectobacterium brasiliense TaxID=180957 RepID=UPI00215235DC|nr:shufflon system plasmid conjugative transfer pilus tip adhesin PilV [Pectobacterium brasiliense]
MLMFNKPRTPHRGWALMEFGAALLILLSVAIWGTSLYRDYMQELQYQVMAQQGTRFKAALKGYAGRYYDMLLGQAGTATPVIVTTTMLKNTGFLQAGFSETNPSGQRWQGAIVRNAQNTSQLQALAYTHTGSALPFKALRFISSNMNGGGYIWETGQITGALGIWKEPLATFGVTTTPGQLAAVLTTDELRGAREESDRLYRFAVNGKPDLNRMHTAIDMGGNSINNVDKVNAENDITTNNGWLVTKNNKGWMNETHGGGITMDDNDWVKVINNKGIKTDRVSTHYVELEKIEIAGTTCLKDGVVARDNVGAILSCQSGAWSGDEKPQGALCGFASDDHLSGNINIYLCKGHNPSISCPHDYVRSRIFQADSNFLYSCVVIKELIGS